MEAGKCSNLRGKRINEQQSSQSNVLTTDPLIFDIIIFDIINIDSFQSLTFKLIKTVF